MITVSRMYCTAALVIVWSAGEECGERWREGEGERGRREGKEEGRKGREGMEER